MRAVATSAKSSARIVGLAQVGLGGIDEDGDPLRLRRQARQVRLHSLEPVDRLAELDSLAGVLDRELPDALQGRRERDRPGQRRASGEGLDRVGVRRWRSRPASASGTSTATSRTTGSPAVFAAPGSRPRSASATVATCSCPSRSTGTTTVDACPAHAMRSIVPISRSPLTVTVTGPQHRQLVGPGEVDAGRRPAASRP